MVVLQKQRAAVDVSGGITYKCVFARLVTSAVIQLNNEEANDIAVKLFNSIQIFNGIMTVGGFEVPEDTGFVILVQNVLGRCLEKEELCDEFFLQLVKQTTDVPDPNGRLNVQNWRLMALACSVAAPINKVCLRVVAPC